MSNTTAVDATHALSQVTSRGGARYDTPKSLTSRYRGGATIYERGGSGEVDLSYIAQHYLKPECALHTLVAIINSSIKLYFEVYLVCFFHKNARAKLFDLSNQYFSS